MSEAKKHPSRRVVIIEDEPAHAEAIRRYLSSESEECSVTIAGSLSVFRKLLSGGLVPDIVLADINLPDGSSMELLQGSIEDNPWPVVVMTSFGDEEIAVKAIKSGAIDYVVKSPEAFREIVQVVRRNLREWRSIQKSRESEKKFRVLFETMDQGVIYLDSKGRISAANPSAEKITGFTLEEMQDMPFLEPGPWSDIHEDGTTSPAKAHPAAIALRSGLPAREKIMGLTIPGTGMFRWLLVSAVPQFRDNQDKPYQVFSTFTDITRLKETENELKSAMKKAEESDRLKSVFMANMSHEIRTPMNGILGFADLLKSPELSGASMKMYIDAIITSGKRMLEIINDLIDISKIEAGQSELRKERISIRGLAKELIMFFSPEARKKGITLTSEISLKNGDITIETDRTKLAQILTNLLKNALKFTPEGGSVELGCRMDQANELVFRIKDNGIGIRRELQEKIFERFRQGDDADNHEGVGLGLAISKAYAELLGGRISLESEPGAGSTFSLILPYHDASPHGEEQEYLNEAGSTPAMCILVAEDDDLSYTLLQEALKKSDITTCRVANGKEAVEFVRTHDNINLVLMDIKLPVMNGLEATKEIMKFKPELPVIAQSAYVSQADIRHSLDAGCVDYITKPVDIRLLLSKISRYSLPVS